MVDLAIVCGILGLLFGSFANVCVYRIPRAESLAWPASHCPHCQHAIAAYDNIPVFSWLYLKGRCRYCQAAISKQYPALELLMGLSWFGLAWFLGWQPLLALALCLSFYLWVLAWIDMQTMLLPDVLTFSGMFVGLCFSWWLHRLPDALIGMCVGYAVFWLLAYAYRRIAGHEGMGYGDFKLLAMLGAFLGWQALPGIVFLASTTGAVLGGLMLSLKSQPLSQEIPFGPFLAAAGMFWLLFGDAVWAFYLSLMT